MKEAEVSALGRIGNILIVDDEPLVRRGLAAILRELFTEDSAVEICEAEDGLCATEILRQKRIGLVFTDIKMPNMDGLALLGWISANCPDCQTAVLSCHDDYDFVRQAFHHNIVDYILKFDIDREGVESILQKVLARKTQQAAAGRSGLPDEETIYDQWTASLRPELPEQAYYRLSSLLLHSQPAHSPLQEQALLRLLAQTAGSLQLKEQRFFVRTLPQARLLILHCSPGALSRSTAESLYATVRQRLAAGGEPFCLVLGRQRKWVSSLKELFRPLQAAELRSFYAGPGLLFSEDFKEQVQNTARSGLLSEFKVEAYALLAEGSLPSLRSRLMSLASVLAADAAIGVEEVKALYREIADLTAVCRRDQLAGGIEESLLRRSREEIAHAGSFAELEAALKRLLDACSPAEDYEHLSIGIRRALAFIHANFEKRGFSLTDIAEELGYSHSYLSRQFKKETGVNIVTCINNLRLAEAKRLLAAGRCLVYEAAAEVCYNNYTYFSKMYKKRYGVSPANDEQ